MSVLSSVLSPVLQPVLGSVFDASLGSGTKGALSPFVKAAGAKLDYSILVVGDSTGNESTEWVYLSAERIAQKYPDCRVSYRLWDDVAGAYMAPVYLGISDPSFEISIWNCSLAGAISMDFVGAASSAAIAATGADLLIWSMGHNEFTGTNPPVMRGSFLTGIENARLLLPGANLLMVRQNPRRDDDLMAPVVAMVDEIASLYGDASVLDAYGAFVSAGKASDLYVDNQHPSPKGSALWADEFLSLLSRSAPADFQHSGAMLSQSAPNLLQNGDVHASGGTGWGISGGSFAVDNAIFDAGRSSSLRASTSGASASNMLASVPAASLPSLRGGVGTLAVRMRIPTGQPATCGRLGLGQTSAASISLSTRVTQRLQGAWFWLVMSGFEYPGDTSAAAVRVFVNSAAGPATQINVDRISLVPGLRPRDI